MERTTHFSDRTMTEIASTLQMSVDELARASVRAYLHMRLAQVESTLGALRQRYQVRSSAEMEQAYRAGALTEKDSWEDFFRLDHLEAEEASLRHSLESL